MAKYRKSSRESTMGKSWGDEVIINGCPTNMMRVLPDKNYLQTRKKNRAHLKAVLAGYRPKGRGMLLKTFLRRAKISSAELSRMFGVSTSTASSWLVDPYLRVAIGRNEKNGNIAIRVRGRDHKYRVRHARKSSNNFTDINLPFIA